MEPTNVVENTNQKKGMKKGAKVTLLVLSILFFLAAIITPIVIFAMPKNDKPEDTQMGNYILRLVKDGDKTYYDIVRYIGDETEVSIPSDFDGIKVRAILANAFDASKRQYSSNITKITIGNGIRSIGVNAFKDCTNVTELELPQSMQRIDKGAFEGSGLKKLSVKNASGLRFMPGALDGADDLKTLNIVGSNDTVGSGSLSNIDGVTEVVVDPSVVIDSGAFTGASSVTTLTVYNTEKLQVEDDAFNDSNITTLNVRKLDTTITETFMKKFAGLSGLKFVNLEEGIDTVSAKTFASFANLEKLSMADNTAIDISALPLVNNEYVTKVVLNGKENQTDFTLRILNENTGNAYNTLKKSFLDGFEFNKITKVYVSENFTTIADSAFAAYSKMNFIDFGTNSKVDFIGSSAFAGGVQIKELDVVGPTVVSSKVYEQFNMSKGLYHDRKSYNGVSDIGSYFVNLDYRTDVTGAPAQSDLKEIISQVEIMNGASILASLPKDKIELLNNGKVDIDNSVLIARGWKISWYYNDGSNDILIKDDIKMSKDFSEKTIFAKWMPVDNARYTVNYYIQNVDLSGWTFYGKKVFENGVTGQLAYAELIEIEGFSAPATAPSEIVKGTDDTAIRVEYVRNTYNVSFDLNDKINSVTNAEFDWTGVNSVEVNGKRVIKVLYNGTYGKLPIAVRPGYRFLGWFTALVDGEEVKEGVNFTSSKDVVLYARYEKLNTKYLVEVYQQTLDGVDGDSEYVGYSRYLGVTTGPDGGVVLSDTLVTFDMSVVQNIIAGLAEYDEGSLTILDISSALPGGFEGRFELYKEHPSTILGAVVNGKEETTVLRLFYNRVRYTIKYNPNNVGSTDVEVAEGSSLESISLKYGANYILPTVTKNGYAFGGWNTKADGTGETVTTESTVPFGTLSDGYTQTLHAIWVANQYTIRYVLGSGETGVTGTMSPTPHTFDQASALRKNAYEKEGFTFAGWSYKGQILQDQAQVSTLAFGGTIDLTATFKANKYTVVYNKNNNDATGKMDNAVYSYGDRQTAKANTYELTGHTFTGWNTRADGNGETVTEIYNLSATDGATIQLFAQWRANNYTVSFDGNGATNDVEKYTQSAVYGTHFNLEANKYAKNGYTFVGWNTEKTATTALYKDAEDVVNLTAEDGAEVALFAIWSAKLYEIIIHKNDGTAETKTQTVRFDNAKVTNPFTRAGYGFGGFATTAEGNPEFTEDSNLADWIISQNETNLDLYVVWATGEATYTVEYYLQTFDRADGYRLFYPTSATASYVEEKTATGSTVTKTAEDIITHFGADKFVGFEFDAVTTGTQNTGIVAGNGSTILKVYFQRKSFTATFDENVKAGTTGTVTNLPENLTVIYGLPYGRGSSFGVPNRADYDFVGWSLTDDGSSVVNANEDFKLEKDVTLYAIWSAKTITYRVRVFLQNTSGTDYTEDLTKLQTLQAKVDTVVSTTAENITGFTFDAEKSTTSMTLVAGETNELKLYYTRNKINLVIKVDGNEVDKKEFYYDQDIDIKKEFETPSKDGFTFDHFEDKNGENVDKIKAGTEDIEIDTVFTENTYTITIDANNGSVTDGKFSQNYEFVDGKFVVSYTSTVDLAGLTDLVKRTGYTLVGFKKSADGTIAYAITAGSKTEVTGEKLAKDAGGVSPFESASITLFADWQINTYTVKYTNGANSTEPEEYNFNAELTLKNSNTFEKKGYHFTAWKDVADEKTYATGSTFVLNEARNYEFTPVWENDTFTVKFAPNKPEATKGNVGGEVNNITLTYDTASALPANGYTLIGYTFLAWNTKADATGDNYKASQSLDIATVNKLYETVENGEITLYAVWEANQYTLRIIANNVKDETAVKEDTLTYDEEYVLSNTNSAIRFVFGGYNLLGWDEDSKATTPKYLEGTTLLNLASESGSVVTLYAIWGKGEGIAYQVIYYTEKLDGTGYSEEIEELTGTQDDVVSAVKKSITGFTFDESNAGNVLSGKVDKDNLLVLKVYYTRNTYTVNFESNDSGKTGELDGDELTARTFKYEEAITLPTITKKGYTFDGWFTKSQDGEKVEAGTLYTLTADTTYFAHWTAGVSEYEVRYYLQNLDGTYSDTANESEILKGTTDTFIVLETIKKDYKGFTFSYHVPEAMQTITADKVSLTKLYYKRNTYSLVLELGVGVESFVAETGNSTGSGLAYTVLYGDSVTLVATAQTGYTLAGFVVGEATQDATFTMADADLSVKAIAVANKYYIDFVVGTEDGKVGSSTVSGLQATIKATFNQPISETELATPTAKGYIFKGYFTEITGGVEVTKGSTNLVSAPASDGTSRATVYARFTAITFTVEYNGNGATGGSTNPSTFTYDKDAILPANGFTKTGYNFAGWSYGEQTYKVGDNVKNLTVASETLTFSAKWTAKTYNVEFNGNYAGAETSTLEFTYDSENNILADALTRKGYNFLGWNTDKDATEKAFDAKENVGNQLSNGEDVTLYAIWTAHKFTVTYNGNGATNGTMGSSTFTYDAINSLERCGYTKAGYAFAGWATSKDGEVVYEDGANIGNDLYENENSNATIFAIWTAGLSTYKVEYYLETLDGAYGEAEETLDKSGETDVAISDTLFESFKKEFNGFKFDSFTTTNAGNTLVVKGDNSLVIKLYYTRNTYTLSFDVNVDESKLTSEKPTAPSAVSVKYKESLAEKINVTVSRTGYNFVAWYYDASLSRIVKASDTYDAIENITVYAKYEADEVSYKVEYYQYSLDSKTSTKVFDDVITAIADTTITVAPAKTYDGFITPASKNVLVRADGTTVVEFYYARNRYNIILNTSTGIASIDATSADSTLESIAGGYSAIYGATINLSKVVKDGYTFTKFVLIENETETEISESFTVSNKNYRIEARATANVYKLTYNKGTGNTGDDIVENITFDTNFKVANGSFAKTGYNFLGYAFTANATSTKYSAGDSVSVSTFIADAIKAGVISGYDVTEKGITLYAIYGKDTFKVTYTYGEESITDNFEFESTQNYKDSSTFSRKGYTFTEWQIEGGEKVKAGAQFVVSASNITLTPVWVANNYTVKFDKNGGSVIEGKEEMADLALTYGLEGTLPENTYARVGYTFGGWSLGGVTYEDKTQVINLTDAVNGVVTLVAIWTPNTDTKYTVYHVSQKDQDLTGSNFTTRFDPHETDRILKVETLYGTTASLVNVLETSAIYKAGITGYTFDSTGTAGYGETSKLIAADGSTEFVIYYKANKYTLTFVDENGKNPIEHTYDYASIIRLPANTFTKTGYEFAGWVVDGVAGTIADMARYVITDKNVTFKATFTARTYTITLEKEGGVGGLDSVQAKYGSAIEDLLVANLPSREGYTFAGFFTEVAGKGTMYFDETGKVNSELTTWAFTENTSLYAYWTANKYTITFNPNGGNGGTETLEVTFNAVPGNIQAPSREGYTFAGYFDGNVKFFEEDGTVSDRDGSKLWNIANNKVLLASWTANEYTVEYNKNGADGTQTMASSKHTYGTESNLSANGFTKTGYDFVGWNTKADGKGDSYDNEATITTLAPSGTIILYAQWKAHEYTVTLVATDATSAGTTTIKVTYDQTPGKIPTVAYKEGYDLVGYFTKENGEGTKFFNTDGTGANVWNIAEDTILYAYFAADQVNVTINYHKMNLDGKTYAFFESETAKGEADASKEFAPSKEYSGFTAPDAKTITVNANGLSVIDFYYTRNKYSVTVSKGTGISEVTPSTGSLEGEYYFESELTLSATTINGYRFGKFTAVSGLTDANLTASQKSVTFTIPASNVEIGVSAIANQYKVIFDANTPGTSKVSGMQTEIVATFDQSIKDSALIEPTAIGYTFVGYSTEKTYSVQTRVTASSKNLVAVPADDGSSSVTVYATWTANTDTVYSVEHYRESLTGEYVKFETEPLSGTTDTTVTAAAKTYDGFTHTSGGVETGNIKADGTTVLTVRYSRNSYTVSFDPAKGSKTGDMTFTAGGEAVTGETFERTVKFEDKIGELPDVSIKGYDFDGWYLGETKVIPTTTLDTVGNKTIVARFTARTDTAYEIEHYFEELDGSFKLFSKVPHKGTTDTTATTVTLDEAGFTFDAENANNVVGLAINGNGTTLLKLYYLRDTDVKYSVEYYLQNVDDDLFTINTKATETLSGKTGATVSAEIKTFVGYTRR